MKKAIFDAQAAAHIFLNHARCETSSRKTSRCHHFPLATILAVIGICLFIYANPLGEGFAAQVSSVRPVRRPQKRGCHPPVGVICCAGVVGTPCLGLTAVRYQKDHGEPAKFSAKLPCAAHSSIKFSTQNTKVIKKKCYPYRWFFQKPCAAYAKHPLEKLGPSFFARHNIYVVQYCISY